MSCWALVPVKARADCKTRLACVLSPEQRLALVRKVLSHVLATLQQVLRIDHIAVVSPERDLVPDSIELLPEQGTDLNSSLAMAIASARARGATRILLLHSDLPYINVADIEALLDGANTAGIALAPDELGEGTNGMCLQGHLDLPLQFGEGSFRAHVASAKKLHYRPVVVQTMGLGFDLDSSADLKKYDVQSRPVIDSASANAHSTEIGVYQ